MTGPAQTQVAAQRAGARSQDNPEVALDVVQNFEGSLSEGSEPNNRVEFQGGLTEETLSDNCLSDGNEPNSRMDMVLPESDSSSSSSSVECSEARKEPLREPPLVLAILLCVLSALEGADVQLLPCAFLALRRDLGLTAGNLAMLGAVQAFSATLSAPLWAFFADQRIMSRRRILILGSIGQGFITLLLGLVTWWVPMIVLRGFNGVMLASLRPVCMGIVADTTAEECRGKVYGRIQLALQLGMFVSTMTATPFSNTTVLGLHGWRVAFAIVGVLGMLVGTAAVLFADVPETPRLKGEHKGRCKLLSELKHVLGFFRTPTFNVLILQGLFGCMAMSAGSFGTMYFQMVGVSDFQAGLLTSFGQIACALGILIGGHLGDWAAVLSRKHGRVLVAEISLAFGIPLVFLRFWGVPGIAGSFVWYAVLISLHGLLAVWVTAGAKLPLLSEIVPADRRSAVMAWDSTLEGSISALLGGPMVALLARSLFGFTSEEVSRGTHNHNARALGRASAIMNCIPALLSLACWPLMHITYPADLRRIAQKGKAGSSTSSSSEPEV